MTSDTRESGAAGSTVPESDRRRRSVRQLPFVIAGSHTGAFIGSTVPSFGLPGDVFSLLLVAVLFALPFVVDANWARIEATYERLTSQ
ncbi:hypothetical protein [Halosegnis sp.]|uniref:hypothetical protein n=1 Tax=Halosegnis sp. TaxID=2864959 RepID=UPI0035D52733